MRTTRVIFMCRWFGLTRCSAWDPIHGRWYHWYEFHHKWEKKHDHK